MTNENHDDISESDPLTNEESQSTVSNEMDEQDSESSEDLSEEYEEEEFSLDQLSAAYAEVLKKRPPANADQEALAESDPANETKQTASRETVAEKSLREAQERTEDESTEPTVDDDAASPVSPETILESILFVGGPKEVKLNSRKIAAVMRDVSPKEITALSKALNKKYEQENRAYRIVSEKGSLRMELHPDMIPVQNHILGRDRATKLTQQAIDVLAIVAYNQPITREQVDQIRTRPSGSILNQMLKRDLLQMEVTESSPKQKLFRTTDRFLDLFGLEEIEDLPQSHDVSDIEELAD